MFSAVCVAALMVAVVPSIVSAQGVVVPQVLPADAAAGLTLEAATSASLAGHPLVEAARARLAAARGERDVAGALANPSATFWVENAGYPGQDPVPHLARETSFYLTFPIESFFQRTPRRERADEDIQVAEASLVLARRMVAAETAHAFFGVALAQTLREEADANRHRVDQLVAYNRVRVDEGVTAEGELLRLQIELDRAVNDLVLAEVELGRSQAKLAPYLSMATRAHYAAVRVVVPSAGGVSGSALPAEDQMLAAAVQQRPELLAGRARVRAATASADYERSLKVRQLGATFGNKTWGGQNSMVAALSFTVPLFNLNGGGVTRATSERLAFEQDLAWIERSILAEVQSAYDAATRLTRQVHAMEKTFLARAESVHQLTLAAYREGGATLLQVLDATRMLTDARLAYSRTLFAQRESLFFLALASGSEPPEALDRLRQWTAAATVAGRTGDQP
jgi:cobalt-zinc-cadmium efflux system outer membrane protein